MIAGNDDCQEGDRSSCLQWSPDYTGVAGPVGTIPEGVSAEARTYNLSITDRAGQAATPVAGGAGFLTPVVFVVQPVQIKSGDWPLPDDRAVSWIYGSVINYALGMQATPDNKALLSSIRPGDTFILRMSTGPVYRFAFADMVRVSPQSSEIFRQNRPGMTIALLGDEEESTRMVIRGLYNPATFPLLGVDQKDEMTKTLISSSKPAPKQFYLETIPSSNRLN